MSDQAPRRTPGRRVLIEVHVAGERFLRTFRARLLEQALEALIEHLAVLAFGLHLVAKPLVATALFRLELPDRLLQIQRRFLWLRRLMREDGLGLRVDFELGSTAGSSNSGGAPANRR